MTEQASSEEPVVTTVAPMGARKEKLQKVPKRPVLQRLFGISLWGAFKLIVTCVLVGFFLLALEFDPVADDVNVIGALGALVQNLFGAAVWAAKNFWKPLLAGAGIVLPLWILWRLISLPFRK